MKKFQSQRSLTNHLRLYSKKLPSLNRQSAETIMVIAKVVIQLTFTDLTPKTQSS
jgi:hypothetical protein